MTDLYYDLAALEPLVFGDGRPFGNEPGSQRVRSSVVPQPSTLAGAFRTAYARQNKMPFNDESVARLLGLGVRGPVLTVSKDSGITFTPVFARPSNSMAIKNENSKELVLAPLWPADGLACNLPEGIRPLSLPKKIQTGLESEKPAFSLTKENKHLYLTQRDMEAWLLAETPVGGWKPEELPPPVLERRVHVGLEFSTKTSKQSMLYETEGSCLDVNLLGSSVNSGSLDPVEAIVYRLSAAFGGNLNEGPIALGGERRLAICRPCADAGLFDCPRSIAEALRKNPKRICLVLATPAVFQGGWRPGWVDSGCVPGVPGLKLKLVSAACERRGYVSGWDLKANRPKPVRWLAPAGSVYFFEVVDGDPGVLADAWLKPVSDSDQDRKDGFGLALWGIWKESEEQ